MEENVEQCKKENITYVSKVRSYITYLLNLSVYHIAICLFFLGSSTVLDDENENENYFTKEPIEFEDAMLQGKRLNNYLCFLRIFVLNISQK